MFRLAAMTDSPPSDEVFGVGRRDETANAASFVARSGALRSGEFRSGDGAVGGTTVPAVAGVGFSFQSAMS